MTQAALFLLFVFLLSKCAEADRSILESGRRSINDTEKPITYFCHKSGPLEIHKMTEGKIVTLYEGKSSYENNQFCQWNLNAGPGNRLQVVVDEWKLQYAPPRALCNGYDHIKVTDDEGFFVSWCQVLPLFKSPFYINSRGSNVTITFQSDQTTPKNHRYPGAQLSFRIFAFKDVSEDVWFGLNDKSVFGNLKWIDNSSATGAFKAMRYLKADPFKHCGQVNWKESTVGMADCEAEASVLCRAMKGKVSKIYPIPLFKTDKGNDKDSKTSRGLLLGVLIPCVLLLLVIVLTVILYRYRYKFSCFNRSQADGKRTDGK
ncbi:bone morphogenetic protein 1-like [Elysia marginata]|uniref:Bone morphogenetic protein 1-like n=1 Tax=Elysia marginata TaxID=1093978 RepID=A0AAV4HCC5_9GAST|nr:bone morphogenetic protein 1-like [Elysia marginata]